MTNEELVERAHKHIKRCDDLFDGRHEDGSQSIFGGDKEFAYNSMRQLAFELLELIPRKEDND